jgi:hypothetical protein
MNPPNLRTIRSSAEWVAYFLANANQQKHVPWEEAATLSSDELRFLIPSLRGWQLGETSDGSHLLAASHDYAARFSDPCFVEAARLFIAEEQRHGGNLGRFLDRADVCRASSDWGDTVFRAVRYLVPRMEFWATPVVMVETHALIYYNAVRRATESVILRAICEQILADEVAHIRFQCERLAMLHRSRPGWLLAMTMAFHRAFFTFVTLAVWLGHRHALRAGGYRFRRFWTHAWSKMRCAWSLMNPRAYSWREATPDEKLAPEVVGFERRNR